MTKPIMVFSLLLSLALTICVTMPTFLLNAATLGALNALAASKPCSAANIAQLRTLTTTNVLAQSAYLLGECELSHQQYLSAVTALSDANRADPNNVLVLLRRGDAQYALNQLNEATRDWALAGAGAVLFARGEELTRKGYLDKGLGWFVATTTIEQDNALAYWWQGQIYQEKQDYDRAESVFRQAAQLAPDNVTLQLALVSFLIGIRHEYAEASSMLERVRHQWPNHIEPVLVTGQLYSQQGDYDQAAHWYAEANKIAPESAQPFVLRGVNLLAQGKLAQALREFELASSHSSSPMPFNLHNTGFVYSQLGEHEAAAAAFEQAVDTLPRYVPFRISVGQEYEHLGRTCDAILHYRVAASIEPSNQWVSQRISQLTVQGRCP